MNWKLTRHAIYGPQIDHWGSENEDLAWGRSLMEELSHDPDWGLHNLAPGVWMVHKDPGRLDRAQPRTAAPEVDEDKKRVQELEEHTTGHLRTLAMVRQIAGFNTLDRCELIRCIIDAGKPQKP